MQIQFLVSSSLLMQQFLLSCHASYHWEFVPSMYELENRRKTLLPPYSTSHQKRPAKSLPWKVRIFLNSCLISLFFCFTKAQVVIYSRHIEEILLTVEESCCNVMRMPDNGSQTPSSSLHACLVKLAGAALGQVCLE